MRFLPWRTQMQFLHRLGLCDKIIRFEDTTIWDVDVDPPKVKYLWRNHRKVFGDTNATNFWPEIYNFNDRVEYFCGYFAVIFARALGVSAHYYCSRKG